MSTSPVSQQLWSQYIAALASEMGAGATEAAIQVLPAAQLLSGTTAAELGASAADFVNQIPQWGAVYEPSDQTLIQAYQVILTQAQETATNGTSIQAEFEAASQVLAKMMGRASALKIKQIKQYAKQVAVFRQNGIPTTPFFEWFVSNGLQEYSTLLQEQQQQETKVMQLLQASGLNSPLVAGLAALNKALEASKKSLSPAVTLDPNAAVLAGWATAPTNPGGVGFTESSATYDASTTVWKQASGVDLLGFVSVGLRGSEGTHKELLSGAATYSIRIEYQAQAAVALKPGSWFDGSLLRLYKDGPWIKGSQLATGKAKAWGEGGLLPLVATKALVVMNPTIAITLDTSLCETVYDQLSKSAADGISVGPFGFGGAANASTTTVCTSHAVTTKQTLTIRDRSNIPQVVAVVDQVMP